MRDYFEIDAAPWCRPRTRLVADNGTTRVYVTTTYGYHVIAALLYALWRKMCAAASFRGTSKVLSKFFDGPSFRGRA
jgi:hypothetical protein